MLYLTCTMISSVELAHYWVSRAKDWVSVDCGTRIVSPKLSLLPLIRRASCSPTAAISTWSCLLDSWFVILCPFHQYFSHIRTMVGWYWKDVCNGTLFMVGSLLPQVGLKTGTARSVGQHLTYWATRAPLSLFRHSLAEDLQNITVRYVIKI